MSDETSSADDAIAVPAGMSPVPTTTALRRLYALAALTVAGVAAAYTVTTLEEWDAGFVIDPASIAIATTWLLAGAMLLVGTRGLAARWGWLLIGAGFACYGLGELLAVLVSVTVGELPAFSVADVAWLGFYPLVAAGLIVITSRAGSLPRSRIVLDAALVSLGTVSVLLLLVDLFGVAELASIDPQAQLATGPYLIADILLLGIILALSNARRLELGIALPLAGILAFLCASDVAYWIADGSDSTALTLPQNLGYLVPPLLMILVLGRAHVRTSAPSRDADRTAASRAPAAGALLPLLAVGLALGVLLHVTVNGSQVLVSSLAVAAVLAVIVRLGLAYHDAHALARSRIQVRTDDLTGLPNRRALLWDSWPDTGVTPPVAATPGSAIAVLGIDRFEAIEDAVGHHVGDDLLVMLANRLAEHTSASDRLARLEGELFAVVMYGVTEAEAIAAAPRLLRALDEPVEVGDLSVHLTGTVGVSWSGEPEPDRREQLRLADIARNAAHARHTSCLLFQPDLDDAASRLRLTVQFEQALASSTGLALHYQPIVDLPSGRPMGTEALLRWSLPDGTAVSPGEFLPLVQAAGHMDRLGDWVLDTAVAQIAAWEADGLAVPVAVNVSAESVGPDLPDRIEAALRRHRVPADRLSIEIVEDSTLAGNACAREALARIRALGVRVSIDDFGTGWSGLSYLRRLDFDVLKIDRSFVAAMTGDPTSRAIVRSIVDLAAELGLVVVSEGIETPQEYQALLDLGAQRGQGFGIALPMPADALPFWWSMHLAASADQAGPACGRGAGSAAPKRGM